MNGLVLISLVRHQGNASYPAPSTSSKCISQRQFEKNDSILRKILLLNTSPGFKPNLPSVLFFRLRLEDIVKVPNCTLFDAYKNWNWGA